MLSIFSKYDFICLENVLLTSDKETSVLYLVIAILSPILSLSSDIGKSTFSSTILCTNLSVISSIACLLALP